VTPVTFGFCGHRAEWFAEGIMPAVMARTTGPQHGTQRDYSRAPMIVYWEMTQACALACKHCRAEAIPRCHPQELSHQQSRELLQQLVEFDGPAPHLILTGGDPLTRADLFELIDEAQRLGIGVSITPSATPALTPEMIGKLKAHGIQALGLSLDGSTAQRHEAVRGVSGCFELTVRAARAAAELEVPIQINTLVSEETADDLADIYTLLSSLKVMRWSLFFLISVGRGKALHELSPERGEELMNWVYELGREAPFAIKTTEAPSYRRVALGRMMSEGLTIKDIQQTSVFHGFGIRDGHGIVFISNTGEIFPSGFLPMSAGNVKHCRLAEVYQKSPLFQSLHRPEMFKGKCGRCEYHTICGGSRARAFAHTGDPLASDPFCPYEHKRIDVHEGRHPE
jgi:AdoMet-dependent heme synthase